MMQEGMFRACFGHKKKTTEAVKEKPRQLTGEMFKYLVLCFVDDVLCTSDREVKFLCQFFKSHTIK